MEGEEYIAQTTRKKQTRSKLRRWNGLKFRRGDYFFTISSEIRLPIEESCKSCR